MNDTKIINNTLVDVDSEGNFLGDHFEPDEDMLFDCFVQKLENDHMNIVSRLRREYDDLVD